MGIYEELVARGLIAQVTDEEEIRELINNGKATFYIGFDPTADSLHVGHFMALCLMKRLQMAGNKPIALLGGGTGMIGDPSGKTDMRKMLTKEDIQHNCECFKKQMSRFIDFSEGKAIMVNNADWLLDLNYVVSSLRQCDEEEITLLFDNEDRYFPLDYTEVSIKRRVYEDGTNEYYLNDEKCRLKDITDLLLDSGIAKESFNIISQGKIEEIISSKPGDRRTIIEEAAGVLKYKRRKEEAIRKLDKTNDNMDRVNDIISELENQVEPLKEQRDKALKYQDAKEELDEIELALIVKDITDLNYKINI